MLPHTTGTLYPFPTLSMTIDDKLLDRIEELNDRGVSLFRLAKLAGVQPATVRRFVDGISTRMEEETYMKLCAAVMDAEARTNHDTPRKQKREPTLRRDMVLVTVCWFLAGMLLISICLHIHAIAVPTLMPLPLPTARFHQ